MLDRTLGNSVDHPPRKLISQQSVSQAVSSCNPTAVEIESGARVGIPEAKHSGRENGGAFWLVWKVFALSRPVAIRWSLCSDFPLFGRLADASWGFPLFFQSLVPFLVTFFIAGPLNCRVSSRGRPSAGHDRGLEARLASRIDARWRGVLMSGGFRPSYCRGAG